MEKTKVWFVTGASKGLGLTLVKKLLSKNYKVAATSRSTKELVDAVDSDNENFLALEMDLLDEKNVQQAIENTVKRFGQIDVLVNNAGYGLVGALEELSDKEARQNFDVNVFGSLNVIRAALPYLRKQKSGHIFNIASIAGFTGAFPGFGIYCATKFAMHGFSESLAVEVKPFGINVTIVSPGYFRTNFLASSLAVPANELSEYNAVREVQATHQNSYNGNQPGDPEKATALIMQVAQQSEAPLHLFLGADAYALAEAKLTEVKKEMDAYASLGKATSFDPK